MLDAGGGYWILDHIRRLLRRVCAMRSSQLNEIGGHNSPQEIEGLEEMLDTRCQYRVLNWLVIFFHQKHDPARFRNFFPLQY